MEPRGLWGTSPARKRKGQQCWPVEGGIQEMRCRCGCLTYLHQKSWNYLEQLLVLSQSCHQSWILIAFFQSPVFVFCFLFFLHSEDILIDKGNTSAIVKIPFSLSFLNPVISNLLSCSHSNLLCKSDYVPLLLTFMIKSKLFLCVSVCFFCLFFFCRHEASLIVCSLYYFGFICFLFPIPTLQPGHSKRCNLHFKQNSQQRHYFELDNLIVVGGCLVHCRMLSCTPDIYSLDTHSIYSVWPKVFAYIAK